MYTTGYNTFSHPLYMKNGNMGKSLYTFKEKNNVELDPRGDLLNIITLSTLTNAIEETLDIDANEAKKYARIVMDFFGFEDRIIDNLLGQADRQLFYLLESEGLLRTQRDLITINKGRRWRIHYWILAKKTILGCSSNPLIQQPAKKRKLSAQDTIYSSLPQDMWTTRKKSAI